MEHSRLLAGLHAFTAQYPHLRKRLIGPDINFGRELLVTLARSSGGWIGWEATTLRAIADEFAFLSLADRSVRSGDDVAIGALIDQALDTCVERRAVTEDFLNVSRGLGFRTVLRDAVLELRMEGVTADEVATGAPTGSPAANLPAVMREFQRLLDDDRLADPSMVFRAALGAFATEAQFVLDGVLALAPLLRKRGLPGQLIDKLLARGATILGSEIPADLAVPDGLLSGAAQQMAAYPAAGSIDFFAAVTPSDEVREVFRRVVIEGWRWDQVEIVTTDKDTYGIALAALCDRVGVPATMLEGVPLGRTRLGRGVERWFNWLDSGLPADTIREALEAGELGDVRAEGSATEIASELRRMKIGWGRERYEATVRRLESPAHLAQIERSDEESDDEFIGRHTGRERSARSAANLLRDLLAVTPPVPERGGDRAVMSSLATLARSTAGYLALVPTEGPAEAHTLERLTDRLARLRALPEHQTVFAAALAELRDGLSEVRAWPDADDGRRPHSPSGGAVHLSTVAHAGTTGRPRAFVVGLDADRVGGAVAQDALLPDSIRRSIAPSRLPTSSERHAEWTYLTAASVAGLRGRVTLSYAARSSLDGRDLAPATLLLRGWRVANNDATLSYEQLRSALSPPASAVPLGMESTSVDARDTWLRALSDGSLLRDGSAAVRAAFPMLAAGLDAREARAGVTLSPFDGLLPEIGGQLDPTLNPAREMSPSALELFAGCPLSWFYRYGLRLRLPEDPEYEANLWLDPAERGSLLHQVFETFGREYQGRQGELQGAPARDRIQQVADAAILAWKEHVPPPSQSVFEAEARQIRTDVLSFLEMERDLWESGQGGGWREFEFRFGRDGKPGEFTLANANTIAIRGRVDRIDTLKDGTLGVIDYKTGGPGRYARTAKDSPFHGGRQLQPVIYAGAVSRLLGGEVSRFEYRFPTDRGQNTSVAYDAADIAAGTGIVDGIVEDIRAGRFLPTTEAGDCSYCEAAAICRVRRSDFGTDSPRAEWASANSAAIVDYESMLHRRTLPVAPASSTGSKP